MHADHASTPDCSSDVALVARAASVSRWQEAVAYACRAHRNQYRRDGKTPYASHVLRVALTLTMLFKCDDETAVLASILHDTIEDTTTDYEDLLDRFGRDAADCVATLTKNMALPEEQRELDYDDRLAKGSWQARLVKLADAYDNLCDLENLPPESARHKHADAVDRARRAIALGRADANNACTQRALELVTRLIADVESCTRA
jgi:guanosine-3',5'-bis(diphosphate) 3'-pyrophosphohydrolase